MRSITTIEYPEASQLQDLIIEKAAGRPIAVVVVDASGAILTSAVLPGAEPMCLTWATKKALTAINYREDTIALRHSEDNGGGWQLIPGEKPAWSDDDVRMALAGDPNFTPWGGGVRVWNSNADLDPIGAVGVSGLSEVDDHYLASETPDSWLTA